MAIMKRYTKSDSSSNNDYKDHEYSDTWLNATFTLEIDGEEITVRLPGTNMAFINPRKPGRDKDSDYAKQTRVFNAIVKSLQGKADELDSGEGVILNSFKLELYKQEEEIEATDDDLEIEL